MTCLEQFGPQIWNVQTRFSKKFKKCHFFWILSRFVLCMITKISASDAADIEAPHKYSEHIHLISRKVSTDRWSQKCFRKIRKKLQLNIGIFNHLSIKYDKKCSFTIAACKKFYRVRKYCIRLRYLSGAWISELSNASTLVIIRRTVTKIFTIYWPYE